MALSFQSVLPPATWQVQGLPLVCFQVTIITSGALVTEDSSVASLHHQQVALLATANGTHIAVQLEDQQTLEEAISVATAAMQQGAVTLETTESGC